jgi:hypothetical protein
MAYRRGEQVVWRSRPQGQLATVMPLTVIQDSPGVIALIQHDGCVYMKRTGRRGGGPGGRLMLPDGWDGGHSPVRWVNDVVKVHVPGTHHSVMRRWDRSNGDFEGWYVNLELPWVRTTIGFDSLDLVLDVVVEPDLSSAHLKDEAELDWSVEHGVLARDLAISAHREAARVFELIAARDGAFGADWSQWSPDPSWPMAQLPDDWRTA